VVYAFDLIGFGRSAAGLYVLSVAALPCYAAYVLQRVSY
jgi:hypothetical protein